MYCSTSRKLAVSGELSLGAAFFSKLGEKLSLRITLSSFLKIMNSRGPVATRALK